MKILMTGPDNNPATSLGGIVTVINMILNNARSEVIFFNRDPGERGKLVNWLRKILGFRSLLNRYEFSLVHINLSFDKKSVYRDLLLVYLATNKRIPVIVHLHGGLLTFNKNKSIAVRHILKFADKIIVLNETEKTSLCSLYGIPTDRISILRNCIDFHEIPQFAAIKPVYNRIIYFGRIHKDKGLKEIVEAMDLLKQKNLPFHLEVYGSGPDEDWFIEALRTKLGSSFEYKGVVWGKAKWHSLHNSDIFLLPSYGEGMPMALLEAMALGKAVIVSDDEAFKKVVVHDESGLLTVKRSSSDLAEKIAAVLTDPLKQEAMGTRAQAAIKREYYSE
ncbi:MAG: glycosyltransferase family 4 protein [Chitinophagaceae bacterium]|nr:glycosyltransferase family 4 protein [Chitinophagaceae bacterium]